MMKAMVMLMSSRMSATKNHMVMIIMIILSCTLMSCFMFSKTINHWFSMLPIIIYISGIMVLFMFIVSLVPNEKNFVKTQNLKMMMVILVMLTSLEKINIKESESMKLNSMLKWNPHLIMMVMIIVLIMAYLPPKVLMTFYKGMKTSK